MRGIADQQGVAVRRGLRRHAGADDGAGSAAVVHDDRHPEALRHFRRDHARDHVGAAARRERNDEPYRLGRIRGGCRRGRRGTRRKHDRSQDNSPVHLRLLVSRSHGLFLI
jgi:hypothetical protein